MEKKSKILLLGGTGFVGRSLLPGISDFADVYIPCHDTLPDFADSAHIIRCDSADFFGSLLEKTKDIKFDFVLNLIRKDFDRDFVVSLIEFLKSQKNKNDRCGILHFSSIAEYRKTESSYSISKRTEKQMLLENNVCDAILTLPIVRPNPVVYTDLQPFITSFARCKKLLNNMMISIINHEFLQKSVCVLLQNLDIRSNKPEHYVAISCIEKFADFLGISEPLSPECSIQDVRNEICANNNISDHLKDKLLRYLEIADIDDENQRRQYNHHLAFGDSETYFCCSGQTHIYQDVVCSKETDYTKLFPKQKLSS